MKHLLKNYVNSKGKDKLFSSNELKDYLISKKRTETEIMQYLLVINCGNLKEHFQRNESNISSIEMNNIVIGTSQVTGLTKETVSKILEDVLYALNINYSLNKFCIPNEGNNDLIFNESSFVPYEIIERELHKADLYAEDGSYNKAIEIYQRIAKSGSPRAMYKLGMCYYDGIGTEKSKEKGLAWLYAAAENGDPSARIKLGDYYYFNDDILKRDFSKAYELYSGPGVLAVNPRIKKNIVSIINQKKTNFIVLVLGGFVTFLMWLLLFINPQSVHHGSILVGWGIPLTIVPTLIYGFACYLYKKLKYNNLKILITVMLMIWSIYPLILAIN